MHINYKNTFFLSIYVSYFSVLHLNSLLNIEDELLQNRPKEGCTIYYYRNDPPFFSGGPPPPTRFALPTARERCLSMPEIGEKKRNYLCKNYTDLE